MPQAGIELSQGIGDAGVVDILKNETLGLIWIAEGQVMLPFPQYSLVGVILMFPCWMLKIVHVSSTPVQFHLTQDMQCPASATHLQWRDRASSLKPGRKTI